MTEPRHSPKLSATRIMMYAAAGVHGVSVATALTLFALYGTVYMRAVVVFTVLGAVAALWVFIAHTIEDRERTAHLFPQKVQAPKIFTDFKDDTGRNL